MSDLVIALEPWAAFWPDAEVLANAHFDEVDGGVEPNRPFKLDLAMMGMADLMGTLKIITARVAGRMVGYLTWNVQFDVESEGLLIALQGAWFVAPGFPKVAVLLFDFSVKALRSMGVRCIFPHHRVQGRGANIGRFFKRRGAKKIQDGYCLWIGT